MCQYDLIRNVVGEQGDSECITVFHGWSIEDVFIWAFDEMSKRVHQTAKDKGWWEDRENVLKGANSQDAYEFAEIAVKLMNVSLVHSELSEAVENIRHGCPPDDKVPEFSGESAEYADAIIRIMDLATYFGIPVARALVAKAEMNKGRGYKHGKKA